MSFCAGTLFMENFTEGRDKDVSNDVYVEITLDTQVETHWKSEAVLVPQQE